MLEKVANKAKWEFSEIQSSQQGSIRGYGRLSLRPLVVKLWS